MSALRLNAADLKCLKEVRDAKGGLTLYPGPGFFCSGSSSLHGTTFRRLAGNGLINVIDRKIVISYAGADYLLGAP